MKIAILKDVLIARGQIDRYYEGLTPVHLWRALKTKENAHPFHFVEQPFMLSNGRPRPADITIETVNGQKWVRITDRPRGVSTFDKSGVPPGRGWEYYRIPKGTELPSGLVVVRDELNVAFGATHYTIAPDRDMPLDAFKMLLNRLGRSLIKDVG